MWVDLKEGVVSMGEPQLAHYKILQTSAVGLKPEGMFISDRADY